MCFKLAFLTWIISRKKIYLYVNNDDVNMASKGQFYFLIQKGKLNMKDLIL